MKKKYELLLKLAFENFGWVNEHFEDRTKVQNGRSEAMVRVTRIYLLEQYNLGREHWVLDEDGSMMWISSVPWQEGQNPDEMVDN